MCVAVWTSMQCVCVLCGGECVGGLWGMQMGHGGVVADPPHPHYMGISSNCMHGWGWGVAAVVSAVGVCGCVWVVQRRAGGCGAASQAYLRSAAPSSAGFVLTGIQRPTCKLNLQTPQ